MKFIDQAGGVFKTRNGEMTKWHYWVRRELMMPIYAKSPSPLTNSGFSTKTWKKKKRKEKNDLPLEKKKKFSGKQGTNLLYNIRRKKKKLIHFTDIFYQFLAFPADNFFFLTFDAFRIGLLWLYFEQPFSRTKKVKLAISRIFVVKVSAMIMWDTPRGRVRGIARVSV